MMLKVEAYAAGSDEPVQPVLHICLATADPETGVCLSVGRKEGLVRFEHDKSVSRRDHCLLRFVSSTESAFPSQNPEQSDAVDSMHNLAVVLQNQGKLGSVLIHEPEKQLDKKEKPSPGKDDDSATLDSAATMDDVDAGPLTGNTSSLVSSAGPPGAALSQAAIRLLGSDMVDQVRLDVLGTEQTRVLSPLSLPNGRIIVQCGKLGSTIVISRLDTLTFVRSGFGSKKILPWLKKLHWIGAHEVTPWSTNSIHSTNDADKVRLLVTPKQEPSYKQLAAWSLHVPIVAPSYFESLLERKDPSLPLPNPQDHEAANVNKNSFWKALTPDRDLLRGSNFLSTKGCKWLALFVRVVLSASI